ncbi:UNVERIFIED_CONTAM: hypothetical protein GTU68_041348 [Idotea baltica]|nr:hypothetical protein [Idotea baltica]
MTSLMNAKDSWHRKDMEVFRYSFKVF